MSWSKNVTLWCDGDDCREFIYGGRYVRRSRQEAKKSGWKYIDGKDYCPGCAEELFEDFRGEEDG